MYDISFAQTGDTHIAYRVIGEPGGVDVVMVAGSFFPLELLAEDRIASRFMKGLASLGRLVVFDKRGVGLSDPFTDWSRSAQEQWVEDLVAVIEAAGLDRPVVVSWETLGVARLAAARHPDLVGRMILINPRRHASALRAHFDESAEQGDPTESVERLAFPTRFDDPDFRSWLSRAGRSGASPSTAPKLWAHALGYSGQLTPEGISVPTLVLHRRDSMAAEGDGRAVADAIEDAEFVQVPGLDAYPIAGDVDPLIAEISRFVTGASSGLAPERTVAVVVFTDVVDSTRRASDEGDRRWRDLLDIHDQVVRRCVLHRGGEVVKYTGDGVLALVPSATSAIETVEAVRDELRGRGILIRAGVHVGDVDVRGNDVSGIVVNVAARIMSLAEAGETLVSESVRLGTMGSGFRYTDTRTTDLKGVPEEWILHRWCP